MNYLSGKVHRWHTDPWFAGKQNVADHSWGVAVIMNYLFPEASKNLLLAALLHDVGEKRAGDLPFGFKQQFPTIAKQHEQVEQALAVEDGWKFPELTPEEEQIRVFCDRLEAVMFAKMQFRGMILPEKWKDEINNLSWMLIDVSPVYDRDVNKKFTNLVETNYE